MNVLLQVGADWQRTYTPAKTSTACALVDQPVLSCVTGALAAPSAKTKHLVYIEARGQVGKPAWLPSPDDAIGISLRATHDLHNDETGVDLPLYLLRGGDGAFTGGVRFGWTSTDQFGFGVFVSSTLNLFKKGVRFIFPKRSLPQKRGSGSFIQVGLVPLSSVQVHL